LLSTTFSSRCRLDARTRHDVEEDFGAAHKAHPGLRCASFDPLLQQLRNAGVEVIEDTVTTQRRAFIHDPFGNRIELIAVSS